MPRGGRRPGAGRKKKYPGLVVGHVLPHPAASAPVVPPSTNYQPAPVEEFDAPDDLEREERQVWMQQAPHAFRNRTLTKASALSFERYCRVVVLERHEGRSSGRGGGRHLSLLRQINAYELQFMLTPAGRPMPDPEPAQTQTASKLSRFRS